MYLKIYYGILSLYAVRTLGPPVVDRSPLNPIYVGRFGLPLVGAKCITEMRTRLISDKQGAYIVGGETAIGAPIDV